MVSPLSLAFLLEEAVASGVAGQGVALFFFGVKNETKDDAVFDLVFGLVGVCGVDGTGLGILSVSSEEMSKARLSASVRFSEKTSPRRRSSRNLSKLSTNCR